MANSFRGLQESKERVVPKLITIAWLEVAGVIKILGEQTSLPLMGLMSKYGVDYQAHS